MNKISIFHIVDSTQVYYFSKLLNILSIKIVSSGCNIELVFSRYIWSLSE